ncbi:MAG: C39 family peptidase [Ruminococcus sp.]|nr:C39 family peptidase [Ruminococcus sp.]
MKKITRITSSILAIATALTISTPVFAERMEKEPVQLYSTEINNSNAIKANRESEEFLYGESNVIYAFDKAIRIYPREYAIDTNNRLASIEDTETLLVPVLNCEGIFTSYAEFVSDNGTYKIKTVADGEYYTELYNTFESNNFKAYTENANNIYVCSDPSLNDIGFCTQNKDLTYEYLDYTKLYNDGMYITKYPITSESAVKSEDISNYFKAKTETELLSDVNEPAFLGGGSYDIADNNTTSNIITTEEFIEIMGEDNIDAETMNMLSSPNIMTTIVTSYFNASIAPGNTYNNVNSYYMLANDCVYFNAHLSYNGSISSGDYVHFGVHNSTTGITHYKKSNTIGNHEYTIAVPANGYHNMRIWNDTSLNISVSVTYCILFFHDANNDYNMSIPVYGQNSSTWCWAACTQMIASYYGYNTTQAGIVYHCYGDYGEHLAQPNDYPKAMKYATNYNHTAAKVPYVYSMTQLKNSILMNDPTLILFEKHSFGTITGYHATALSGVDNTLTFIKVNDPANGGHIKCYDYSVITSASSSVFDLYYSSVIFSPYYTEGGTSNETYEII